MEKPTVQLIGQDGNIFDLMAIAKRALNRAGQTEQADIMIKKIMTSGSYEEALNIIGEFCEIE